MPSGTTNEDVVRNVHQTKRMNGPSSAKNLATADGFSGAVDASVVWVPDASALDGAVSRAEVADSIFGAPGFDLAGASFAAAASAASFAACALSRSNSIPVSSSLGGCSTNAGPFLQDLAF